MTLNLLNLLLLLFIYYFFITKKIINFLAIPSKPLALVFDFSALALCLGTTLIEIAVLIKSYSNTTVCIYSLNRAYHF